MFRALVVANEWFKIGKSSRRLVRGSERISVAANKPIVQIVGLP